MPLLDELAEQLDALLFQDQRLSNVLSGKLREFSPAGSPRRG